MHLGSSLHFTVTVVSNCSRVLQSFQEKSRTKAMQNFGINKVHLWSLWKWWILTFQLQQRPNEKGGLPVVLSWFAATCLHVQSQFQALGRTKTCCGYDDRNLAPSNIKKQFHDTEEWRGNLTAFYGKRFFKLGIRREQDRPARKKKRNSGAFLHLNTINNIFHIICTLDSWATMKYHIVWITTAGMTFCKMFDKSLYDYYDSFANEGSWCLQMIYQGS